MISKAMLLGAAAAVVATGTGYYIANYGVKAPCDGGCPIQSMLGTNTPKDDEKPGSCCSGNPSKTALISKKSQPGRPYTSPILK